MLVKSLTVMEKSAVFAAPLDWEGLVCYHSKQNINKRQYSRRSLAVEELLRMSLPICIPALIVNFVEYSSPLLLRCRTSLWF